MHPKQQAIDSIYSIFISFLDTYDFAPPTCEVVSCGTAPVYPDMTADQTGPLDYSQTATYTCNQGYYKTTTENVVCGPTGLHILLIIFIYSLECYLKELISFSVFIDYVPTIFLLGKYSTK